MREILTQTSGKVSAWTTACALYVAGKSGAAEWLPAAVAGFSDPDPRCPRNRTLGSVARGPAGLIAHQAAFDLPIPIPPPPAFAVDTAEPRFSPMLLSPLKKVDHPEIGQYLLGHFERGLIEVASVVEEVRVEPGQTIFEKGDSVQLALHHRRRQNARS